MKKGLVVSKVPRLLIGRIWRLAEDTKDKKHTPTKD